MANVTFIEYATPKQKQSVREKNLQISRLRSHAARASFPQHRRRKTQRSEGDDTERGSPVRRESSSSSSDSGDGQTGSGGLQLMAHPSAGSHDPFTTYPVQIDRGSEASVRLFEIMWARLAFAGISPGGNPRELKAARTVVVQQCMEDSLSMAALNAALSLRRKVAHHDSIDPRRYHAIAIKMLQSRVAEGQGIKSSLFLPIVFLAHYEMHSANVVACKAHLRVLKTLDGMRGLNIQLQTFVRAIDSFCATTSLSRPIFDDISRETEFLLEGVLPGPGFDLHEECLGPSLVDTAHYVVDCLSAIEICRRQLGEHSTVTPLVLRTGPRVYNLPHQLLTEMPGSALKEACVIALGWWLMYASHAGWELHPKMSAGEDARLLLHHWGPKLVERLEVCEVTSELTIWIVATGMTFAATQDVFVYCASLLRDMARQLQISNIRQRLHDYLWSESFNLTDEFVQSTIDWIGGLACKEPAENEEQSQAFRQSLFDGWATFREPGLSAKKGRPRVR